MRDYDADKPLIYIHIPKTAGSALRLVFKEWFGDRLRQHYRGQGDGPEGLPRKLALCGRPLVLYGHFNGALGFGVRDYYPEVEQFLTVVRQPFARVVSDYFFTLGSGLPVPSLTDFILSYPKNPGGILNYFPGPVTKHNYKDLIEQHFVDIGVTEMLDESVARFATKLGKPNPERLPIVNPSNYSEAVPEKLMDNFRDQNELEHDIYDYVLTRQGKTVAPNQSG